MPLNTFKLLTPIEAEELLGKKYFYRQRIYRLAEKGKISAFKFKDQNCYLGGNIIKAAIEDLGLHIKAQFPNLDTKSLRIFYDTVNGKRIVVDGLLGKGVIANTDDETEEDLIIKIRHIVEWIQAENTGETLKLEILESGSEDEDTNPGVLSNETPGLTTSLPEEITWIKVETGLIEGVEVKSYILISLPSIAQFLGLRTDHFVKWVTSTTFSEFILSAHYKQFQPPTTVVPWKRGVVNGLTPVLPFELLPEVIVAFRQSGYGIKYPEKAKLLYDVAKSTLEAVGLAISGNKDKAAEELARVGIGLGLTAADQIIGIFKQYETRDYQVQTNKEFNRKVKDIGADYAVTTGTLTLGITGKFPSQWKALGAAKSLPAKLRDTSREVMRQLSPSDGVGMTFGERHFIKDPNLNEAVETGKQGKDFYDRLKKVGLLDS